MTPCAYTACLRPATFQSWYGANLCRSHLYELNRLAAKLRPDWWERQELERFVGVRV